MKKINMIIAAAMLATACNKSSDDLAVPGPGQDQQANAIGLKSARPFKATVYAVADANAPLTPCSGVVPFAAPDFFLSGSAAHMGPLDAASRLHHAACDLNVSTGLLTTSVTVNLVADNGDILFCSGDDVVNAAGFLGGSGSTGSITGTWAVTGGTGRFAGATGTVAIDGLVDFIANSFTCEIVGSVAY